MTEPLCLLARRFLALTHRDPEAPALLDADGAVLASRRDLARHATVLAGRLPAPLEPGSVAVLSLANGPELVASFLALRRAGLAVALVDASAPAGELARYADAVGARLVVTSPERLSGPAEAWSPRDTVLGRPAARPVPLPPGTAVLKLTSGSTGAPRAVAVSARQLAADTVQILRTMRVPAGAVTLAAIPLTHSYGIGSCLVPLLLAGTPLVLPGSVLPAVLASALAAARVSHFPAVPAMVRALAGLGDLPPLPQLRVCLSAGAPLSPADAGAFFAATGHKVHVFYGSSECGGITYDRSARPVHEAGAVGTAMDRVTVRVVGDDGAPVPDGHTGRVEVLSRAAALGIVPGADGETVLSPGRFLTGDLGVVGPSGGLVLTGRVADIINVAGRKVHPAEVRAVLEAIAGVRSAAVLGVDAPGRGHVVAAAVVLVGGSALTARDIVAVCRRALAPHKVPRRLAVVDELPFNERGKLDRAALASLLNAASPIPGTG